MKRIVPIVMICVLVVLLAGCQKEVQLLEPTDNDSLAHFSGNNVPGAMLRTDSHCIYLMNAYGSSDYSLYVGPAYSSTKSVYSASDVSIWSMEANEYAVVWCEKSDDAYTYYAYDLAEDRVNTVYMTPIANGYQLRNVGLYGNKLYISVTDYTEESAGIYSYDLKTLERELVWKMPYCEEYSLMSFEIDGSYLTVSGRGQIAVIDLTDTSLLHKYSLSETVGYIYAVSYDPAYETCAIYYQNGETEDIGMIGTDGNLISLYSFGTNRYAYYDRILCREGHIYWVRQANISGEIVEHYDLVDYNYLKHEPKEIDRTFSFCEGEEGLLLLSFGDGPKEVFLTEYFPE